MPIKRDYDTTVARMAGNLLAGRAIDRADDQLAVEWAVSMARRIVAEIRRIESTVRASDI